MDLFYTDVRILGGEVRGLKIGRITRPRDSAFVCVCVCTKGTVVCMHDDLSWMVVLLYGGRLQTPEGWRRRGGTGRSALRCIAGQ